MSLISGFDFIRRQFLFLVEQYNNQSKLGPLEILHLSVRQGNNNEFVCSSRGPYADHARFHLDWATARDVADWLHVHPECNTVMDPKIRNHPAVQAGGRAVSLSNGLIIGIAGASVPNLNEATGSAVLSTTGLLLESGMKEIGRHSGCDPKTYLPFSWTPVVH